MKGIFLIFAAVVVCSEGFVVYSLLPNSRVSASLVVPVSQQNTVVTNQLLKRERREVASVLTSDGTVRLASTSPVADYLDRTLATQPERTLVLAKRDVASVLTSDGTVRLASTSPVADYLDRTLATQPERAGAVLVL